MGVEWRENVNSEIPTNTQSSSNQEPKWDSASARISKGLKEKGREQFWPKKRNLRRTTRKNGQNFTPLAFRVNKMFSHKF
jgi:hypothetical protein